MDQENTEERQQEIWEREREKRQKEKRARTDGWKFQNL
jgi:hypothetical protein